ncbi:MAG: class I SAM-dependent methyltransferase [Candidatus Magasanikbacteria bacterium]
MEIVYPEIPLERRVVKPTDRGLKEGHFKSPYDQCLGFEHKEDFVEWLKDKNVLDIGSGYGMLMLDVAEEKGASFSHIFNLGAHEYGDEFDEKLRKIIIREFNLDINTREGKTKLEQAIEFYKTRTIKAVWPAKYISEGKEELEVKQSEFWSSLPFANCSLDRVISNYAFPLYENDLKARQKVLKEIARVLRQNGEMRLAPLEREEALIIKEYLTNFLKFKCELVSSLRITGKKGSVCLSAIKQ